MRLNSFLMEQNVEFDVNTAIKVLRQSLYYKQALELCEKHSMHEDYLKIQLENLNDYAEALNYIKRLDDASAVLNVKKYGKLLMANIPQITVSFLKSLCSKYDAIQNKFVVDPTEFIHIFLKNSHELIEFLEHIHKGQMSSSKVIANTLLELYVNSFSATDSKASSKSLIDEISPPVASKQPSSNTVASLKEKQALEFLTANYSTYDTNLALVICQLHNFKVWLIN